MIFLEIGSDPWATTLFGCGQNCESLFATSNTEWSLLAPLLVLESWICWNGFFSQWRMAAEWICPTRTEQVTLKHGMELCWVNSGDIFPSHPRAGWQDAPTQGPWPRLADLIKDVAPEARDPKVRLAFNLIYPAGKLRGDHWRSG